MRPVHTALLVVLATAGLGLLPACRRQAPPAPPAPPAPAAPVSGWQADDSAATANEVVGGLADGRWVMEFAQTNGRLPILDIGVVDDRSADHVPVAELGKALGKAVGINARLRLGTAANADATLTAVVGLKAQQFTIDARLVDTKTADIRWVGGIVRDRREPIVAPAPVPVPAK